MNTESILTGIITGVLTGGVTGYFTALYATRQFKAQRAFDRQLEWYERTVRALSALSQFSKEQAFAKGERYFKRSEEFQKALFNVEHCVDEAALYAEQLSFEHLQEMQGRIGEIENMSDSESLLPLTLALTRLLNDTLKELSTPVRKMLGLKKLALKDPKE